MHPRLQQFFKDSIWGPNSVHKEDARVKFALRVGYPVYDFILFMFGLFASIGGTPAMRQTFGDDYAQMWGFMLAGAACAAFVGVAFPAKFWRVELYAKSFIVFMLFIYGIAIIYAALLDPMVLSRPDFGRLSSAFGVFGTAMVAVIRIPDIARDKEIHGWK